MNKKFAYILTLVLLIINGMAMAQSTPHVTVGGNVFGGGNKANVGGNSSVLIYQPDASVEKDVYGGGALAHVNVTMTVNNGTDTTYSHTAGTSTKVSILKGAVNGDIYGGGLGDSTKNGYNGSVDKAALVFGKVYVNIGDDTTNYNRPQINGRVFGCNNKNGTPLDSVFVNIYKTAHNSNNQYPTSINTFNALEATVPTDPDDPSYTIQFAIAAVYGGGNRASYKPRLNSDDSPKCTTVHVYDCEENTILTVYGGGNAANVGDTTSTGALIRANTRLIIDGGRYDRVFGGGNGYSATDNHTNPYLSDNTTPDPDYNPGANIFGTAYTDVLGGLYRQVFGGSNQYGDIKTTALTIDKEGCNYLFIHESFGGANEAEIHSDVTTNLLCNDYHIGSFYGGSNLANITGNVTLNVRGGNYSNVFGGSKGYKDSANTLNNVSADIDGDVTLNLLGGTMVNAFGGSDVFGNITGAITVNVWDTVASCTLQVDTVYGGGYNAAYTPSLVNGEKIVSPIVNLWHGTIGHGSTKGCVFGGGKGEGAVVTANPKVMIGDTVTSSGHLSNNQITLLNNGNVFGGGNAAAVDGIDSVLMLKDNSVVSNLFGGGNMADADSTVVMMTVPATVDTIFGGGNLAGLAGTATVVVSNGVVKGGIYGGSNKDGEVVGDIIINLDGGQVGADDSHRGNVHGGGLGNLTSTTGDVEVNVTGGTVYGDVYGGSGFGNVNSTGDTTAVNIMGGTIYGDIYGGGLGESTAQGGTNNYEALVNGKVFVNIGAAPATPGAAPSGSATISGNVFGCNNANGSPQDSVFVNIYQTAHGVDFEQNLYPTLSPGEEWTPELLAANAVNQTYAIQAVFGGGNRASYTPPAADKSTNVYVYGCENTIKDVFGGGNAANVGIENGYSANTFIIIDGGRINRVFGGGNGNPDPANIYGTATTTINAGLIDTIFGGSNLSGSITATSLNLDKEAGNCNDEVFNQVFGGANLAEVSGSLSTTINCGVGTIGEIYGGSNLADVGGNVTLNIRGGQFNKVFGGSKGASGKGADIGGNVTLNLEGGTMVNAFGGSNVKGKINGYITVNVLDTVTGCPLQVDTIYGGGQDASYTPSPSSLVSPLVNIKKASIGHVTNTGATTGCVFGGGKGSGATVTANPKVVVGDPVYADTVFGNVFGGGNLASVVGRDTVIIQYADSKVYNVFGGGNMVGVSSSVICMNGGKADTIYGGCNAQGKVTGEVFVNVNGGTTNKVFGGGYGASTETGDNVTVTVDGGSVTTDVYGGSALGQVNDAPSETTKVWLKSGTVGGNIYGGGLGQEGTGNVTKGQVNGKVEVLVNGGSVADVFGCNNLNGAPQSTVRVDIEQTGSTMSVNNVFGGGNLAQYTGNPVVNIINGTVSQNVFGGGKGVLASGDDRGVKGKITGNPQVTIGDNVTGHTAHVTGDVYGGGDAANVDGIPVVVVSDCNTTIGYLYGGGNAADVGGTNVTVNGGTITQAYGGGHGDKTVTLEPLKYADVNGNVVFNVNGGTIAQVFAGSNSKGSITGTSNLFVNKTGTCAMKVGEVYGGGNEAEGNAGTITIGCTGAWTTSHNSHNTTDNRIGYELEGIGTVYGGANQADVNNGIDLSIVDGIIENVFGGNNTSGSVKDTIRVTINKTGSCDWYVGNVYGGGNLAQYSALSEKPDYPKVRVLNGTVSEDVFGGGLGSTGDDGKVTGNPQVTVSGTGAAVNGGVYGGGSLAPTQGNPLVTLTEGALTKVFGGGKAADVIGAPTVNINDGTVSAGVYGGCDSQGTVSGNITVNVTGGTLGSQANLENTNPVTVDVYGGGYGASTSTSGNVDVTIGTLSNTHSDVPEIYGDVYGGSAFGNVNDDASDKTTVNIYNGTLNTHKTLSNGFDVYNGGNVYGGGLGDASNAAKVNGVVTVNIGAPSRSGRDLNPDDDENRGMATIQGNVYGCNNANGSPQDSVMVNIYRTYRSDSAQIYVPSGMDTVYAIANVFGGGNKANYEPLSTATHKKLKVMIHGCYNSVRRVFGGSNAAAAGTSLVNAEVCTNIDGGRFYQVFGGGNGEVSAADIYGNLDLQIHGGIVGQFYGASNQNGTITGNINTVVDNTSGCQSVLITEYFCGGNFANVYGDLVSTITCSDGMNVTSLYGGCNQANIYGDVVLNLCGGTYTNVFGGSKGVAGGISADILAVTQAVFDAHHEEVPSLTVGHGGNVTLNLFGGTIENVFGGSNIHGNIEGNITVNVIDAESQTCPLYVTNIYGGSNLTDYVPDSTNHVATTDPDRISPVVNIMHAKHGILGNVYGGSKGEVGATITKVMANPRVNIGYESSFMTIPSGTDVPQLPNISTWRTTVQGSVFGGGDAAEVQGNTDIRLNKHAKVIGNVYGGGNMGEVKGDTKVIINGKKQ